MLIVNDTNQATRSFQLKGRLALEERFFHYGKSFRRRGGRTKPFAEFGGCWSPEVSGSGADADTDTVLGVRQLGIAGDPFPSASGEHAPSE
jgi:hypothetical protein